MLLNSTSTPPKKKIDQGRKEGGKEGRKAGNILASYQGSKGFISTSFLPLSQVGLSP